MTKTKVLFMAVVGLLAPLILGQATCPEQTFRDIASCPAQLDPAKIAIDPNTNRACLLGWVTAVVGSGWTWSKEICDPDSDLMTLTASAGTLKVNTDGTYVVTGPAAALGLTYITMTLVDKPPAPLVPITRKGTFVVITIPKNRPPSLCGGLP
jgi:hypothetical protein